jgi:hypothetical protein
MTNLEDDQRHSIETEFFVSAQQMTDTDNWTLPANARQGKDRESLKMASYSLNLRHMLNSNGNLINFINNTLNNLYLAEISVFYSQTLPAPFFINEIRRHRYLQKMTWELPEGYLMGNNLTINNIQLDAASINTKTLTKNTTESTGNKYVFDIKELYDEISLGAATPGLWLLPDDRWYQTHYGDIQATHAALLGVSTGKLTSVFKKEDGSEATNTFNYSFNPHCNPSG